MTHLTPVIHY